jgi:hypothetical protein
MIGVSDQEDTLINKFIKSFTFKRSDIFKKLYNRLMIVMYRNLAVINILRKFL